MEKKERNESKVRKRIAKDRLSSIIFDGHLVVSFYSGPTKSWILPEKGDKERIRSVRDEAVEFVQNHGATHGQMNAVRKALTYAGYYVSR